jgi:hypothetical protein
MFVPSTYQYQKQTPNPHHLYHNIHILFQYTVLVMHSDSLTAKLMAMGWPMAIQKAKPMAKPMAKSMAKLKGLSKD